MIGKTLEGYQVTAKIRDGSVGTVWKAVDPEGKTVALKQISFRKAQDSHKLKEFEREATLTRSLEHPQIIRVYDYVKAKPQPFFVMEYFESENLKRAIAEQPERIHRKEFQILRKLADALAYLHGRDIVHKDVKPENVLVSRKGEIRLIDFSLAKTKWDRRLQIGKKVEGTPLYMAPEQIRGEKCDPRTDIYSFGVLAYELLSRTAPFLAPTQNAILRKQLEDLPPPLMTHVPTASPELNALIFQMIDKDPEKRIPGMKVVLDHLTRWEQKDTAFRLKQVAPLEDKGGPGGN